MGTLFCFFFFFPVVFVFFGSRLMSVVVNIGTWTPQHGFVVPLGFPLNHPKVHAVDEKRSLKGVDGAGQACGRIPRKSAQYYKGF